MAISIPAAPGALGCPPTASSRSRARARRPRREQRGPVTENAAAAPVTTGVVPLVAVAGCVAVAGAWASESVAAVPAGAGLTTLAWGDAQTHRFSLRAMVACTALTIACLAVEAVSAAAWSHAVSASVVVRSAPARCSPGCRCAASRSATSCSSSSPSWSRPGSDPPRPPPRSFSRSSLLAVSAAAADRRVSIVALAE